MYIYIVVCVSYVCTRLCICRFEYACSYVYNAAYVILNSKISPSMTTKQSVKASKLFCAIVKINKDNCAIVKINLCYSED